MEGNKVLGINYLFMPNNSLTVVHTSMNFKNISPNIFPFFLMHLQSMLGVLLNGHNTVTKLATVNCLSF